MDNLREKLEDLETAEDFLTFFEVPFDQRVVDINRLHILQRSADYLVEGWESLDDDGLYRAYRDALSRAYQDFVASDAITERVFKVHKDQAARQDGQFVALDSLTIPRG